MKKLLLISDPIDNFHSVQFELLKSIGKILINYYEVYIFSTYLPDKRIEEFEKLGIHCIKPKSMFIINFFLKYFGKRNESMLWMESWLREAYFNKNSKEAKNIGKFDFVINLSYTIPTSCNMWWIQGRLLYNTLQILKENSSLLSVFLKFFGKSIKKREKKLLEKFKMNSNIVVTNSKHLIQDYQTLGFKIEDIIYSVKDMSKFKPLNLERENFVLTYIGKEIEIDTILELSKKGVKIKGFGAKIPMGISIAELKKNIDYLGFVSDQDLIELYSKAKFVVFPFTDEPFGYIPIESMSCGTPVLSYNKQGPAETILDGVTGWLVNNRDEFIKKALELWKNGHNIKREDCIERAKLFTPEKSVEKILNILKKF